MVAQQPPPQLQLPLQPQQPAASAQDEALKRNTDCVYFLASPLTCKKGNECEYRHSEYARVNPRDCWYWLNGNCLNPKCSFRHPPLDGLLGTPPAAAASGPSVPPPQIATTSAAHAPYNSSKQAVPCIFFQKGLCLKGDRCAFSHGPTPSTGNKVATQGSMTSQGAENSSFKKPFGGIEKHAQEWKTSQGNVARSVGGVEVKPAQKVETAPQKNIFQLEKHVPPPPAGFDNEASRFKISNSPPPVTNGPAVARSNRVNQARLPDDHSFHSGKDSDEFLRESSPGFDVLVADELRNSDYYHGEDEFGKARGQDERNLDSLNEYDIGHSADYSLAADIDRERFRVPQGYDSYDHMQEPYIWEHHRKAPAHLERTRHRSGSPDNVEVSDLRHRLSKRRKGNGLKSVVAHDYALEGHGEEQSHRFSRKDSLHLPSNESSISNRFRGRIKLPPNGGDDHLERDLDRGRIRGKLSSGRLQAPHQGRIQDRIRGGRLQDDERRNFRGRSMGRELTEERTDFPAPKSLAELKNGRSTENREQHSLGKRRSLRDHQQSEDDLPFEGPKPLSEILKGKKGVGTGAASQSGKSPDDSTQNGALPETKEGVKSHLPINEEESKIQVTDGVGREIDNTDATHGQSYEDGMIYDEATEDQEFEGDDDQRDGEYDYEQGEEGEEYEYEQVDEGENQEHEYMDDEEDGEDFAKKIGVVLT